MDTVYTLELNWINVGLWNTLRVSGLAGVCAMVSPDPGISDVYVEDNKMEKL